MNRAYRLAVVGALSAAVLTGGATAAMAASNPAPAPAGHAVPAQPAAKPAPGKATPAKPAPAAAKPAPAKRAPAPAPAKPAPAKAALTAKASATSVKAWEQFRISGTATGIKAGTTVTLQQKQGAKWVSLPASVAVNKSSTYSMRVKLGIKGKNELRIAGGGVVSPVLTVTVR
ncbi:hypothetical protein AB0I22_23600 [Streptomyces sp. NPDC050610]|uniref:hypothetical protein n=1 Tax=Streptomyces sp. NPDC050610 TaxID=3157097 RepID=UPI003416F26B